MIRHLQKNGNKKIDPSLRAKIIALLEKHPRYPNDLYDACARGDLSRSEFPHLLDEMEAGGEIRINQNGLVLLPAEKAHVLHPLESTSEVGNRTQAADMTADEILEHCKQRSKAKSRDCIYPVEHDAHFDNLSRGIYHLRHSEDKTVLTSDFERAGLSIMPTKQDGNSTVKYKQHWNTRRKAKDWGHRAWRNAFGIQFFTGEASRKMIDGTAYYPICWDIEEGLLQEHPDIFQKIIKWATAIPDTSFLISKSGGIRINAWVSFVREKREQMVARREWRDANEPDKIEGITYAEILSGKGLARIDERYLLAKGRIDEFPVLTEAEFMKPLEWIKPLDARIRKQTVTDEVIPALDENLPDGLTWKQGDKFLISTQRYDCEQNHSSNPTCEYRKHDSGTITKWCWACNTSWKIVEGHKRTYTAQKRLEINETEQETYKGRLCAPQTNEASLQNAIADFLRHRESNRSDTTHIFILKYATGIGKSYGALTNARKLGKKVLSLLFNHDLAAEQANTAQMLGYNAYRFKGRGYNFENSNLRPLPLQLREQDETLFRVHQVMCPVYDKLKPYHEKRLNPYMLCFSCPLLDACKSEGYWSQFTELRHADYLSACIQDIIFNPDFWTLLDTFLTGSVPFEIPETDEEAAIAAMLGLQDTDATQDFFQPFDFAMIDDYTTAGLYSEAHYTLEEIANLKNAWAGTHTGDVLKQIHEAIVLLYHDSTQHAVDILTELFDSLDDDTRETVNTNLTQHADRDEYGEVIPTAPWTALRNGIASLDTLTPVWHSKDWTLLHELETLINHCQNTAQAPMFIDTDGRITLSIPPQVHPKIKAILLMSATADIDSTKNAFRGQPVTFSVSEGKPSHWAKGVKGFQYSNARWTTQSIFEYQKDENGKTIYDGDRKPIIVGLRPKAVEMLRKLTDLARTDNRKCVFISYKDFMEGKIAELQVVKELHDAFDTVTHYDIAPGMNFEGYKIFVTFGYPKVDPEVVKREARIQLAHDSDPLNFDYTITTEQGEVYSSTHARYTDPRVENIRQQLATQKLQQADGRARPTRWEDTITINFSAEPVPGFTELATAFIDEDWRNTESFDLDTVIEARKQAEQARDEKETTREKVLELHEHDEKPEDIADRFGISKRHAQRIIAESKNQLQSHIGDIKRKSSKYISIEETPKLSHVTLQEQILEVLDSGEKRTREVIATVDGQPTAIKNELKRLLIAGKIVKVRHGVYTKT